MRIYYEEILKRLRVKHLLLACADGGSGNAGVKRRVRRKNLLRRAHVPW